MKGIINRFRPQTGQRSGQSPARVTIQTARNSRRFCVVSNAKTRVERRKSHREAIAKLCFVEWGFRKLLSRHRAGVNSNGQTARRGITEHSQARVRHKTRNPGHGRLFSGSK